jgi:glycosyltransferase involved in cell wall biosynthesis
MQDVSVIVLTKNSERVLDDCLKSIALNEPAEIIVIDGNSSDRTLEISRKYTGKIYERVKGIASARQLGAEMATRAILAYVDSDVILPEDFLERTLLERKQNGYQGIEGQIETYGNTSYWQWGEDQCRKMYNKPGESTWVGTRATIFDRDVILKFKFDPLFKGSSDSDLSYRLRKAGYKLGRASAQCYHWHRETFKDWAKQRLWRGEGRAAFVFKYRWSKDSLRWFLNPPYVILSSPVISIKMKQPRLFPMLFLDGILQEIGMFRELNKLVFRKKRM